MRALVLALFLGLSTLVSAQSLWLETGVSYLETSPQEYEPAFKFGLRGMLPLADTLSVYLHPYFRGGFGIDGGVWWRFPAGLVDPQGFHAALGAGLSLIEGRFGLALNAAVSYELSSTSEVALVYTHRPLFAPELRQAFDIALAYVLKF